MAKKKEKHLGGDHVGREMREKKEAPGPSQEQAGPRAGHLVAKGGSRPATWEAGAWAEPGRPVGGGQVLRPCGLGPGDEPERPEGGRLGQGMSGPGAGGPRTGTGNRGASCRGGGRAGAGEARQGPVAGQFAPEMSMQLARGAQQEMFEAGQDLLCLQQAQDPV